MCKSTTIFLFISLFCCMLGSSCYASSFQTFEKNFKEQTSLHGQPQNIRHKRAAENNCSLSDDYQKKMDLQRNVHYFRNDTNPTISLTWSGNEGVMLALTTMNSMGLIVRPSRLYRSKNRGKSFDDISDRINHDFIRKSHGILVNPSETSHVLFLGYNSPFKSSGTTTIYTTRDAGAAIQKSVAQFIINDKTVKFNSKDKYRILTLCKNNKLWLSTDFATSWTNVANYVISANWDPLNADILYYTVDPLHSMSKDGIENELYRYDVAKSIATLLAQHVHSFVVQDHYLFLSIQFNGKNGSRVLHVSKSEGHSWNAAQLPMIGKQEFYSLLDMSEDMVFVHVDTPGDTGHGNIFTSDERGIVYSLSLERHLYPNNKGLTDFYKVNSLAGVYITTQLGTDNTVHSRISFDKGGVWEPITPPSGSTCPPTETVCNLQIHNIFSASKGVKLPALPFSSANTVGLIMAHGNLGDSLNFKPPNVYISDDGGYTWSQPSQLKGPHYYGLGDTGGILFAVPSTGELIDTLQFSLDEGQCWLPLKFSDKKIKITGVSAEPGEKATDVTIWGWDQSGDQSWMAITVDFEAILGQACNMNDYVTWTAHESNKATSLTNNCILGAETSFMRRKKGSACLNGNMLVPSQNFKPCPCDTNDFLCDYGFKRTDSSKCVEDNEGRSQHKDICINDADELITTQGYRKIPGDRCQGGNEPPRKVTNLHKKCAKITEVEEDFGVDSSDFIAYTAAPPPNTSTSHPVLIAFLVIAVLVLGSSLSYILYKRRSSFLRVRYTPLSTKGDDKAPRLNGSIAGTQTLVQDDADLVDANGSASGHPAAVISYHDDSDDDLIVT